MPLWYQYWYIKCSLKTVCPHFTLYFWLQQCRCSSWLYFFNESSIIIHTHDCSYHIGINGWSSPLLLIQITYSYSIVLLGAYCIFIDSISIWICKTRKITFNKLRCIGKSLAMHIYCGMSRVYVYTRTYFLVLYLQYLTYRLTSLI